MARLAPLLLLLAACHVDRETPRPRAGVAPVIVPDAGPLVDPQAQRVCELVWTLPASRKAACCKRPEQATLVAACEQALTRSLRAGAVEIDEGHLATCAGEVEHQLQDCDWVARGLPVLPTLCSEGLILGKRGPGDGCVSSLECGGTLHCMAGDGGAVCAPPQKAGARCALAFDLLAPLLRFPPDTGKHACEGQCSNHSCVDPVPEGAPCTATRECARGTHCAEGRCLSGAFARLGEPCSGDDCEESERCVSGTCKALQLAGSPCASDAECQGVCRPADGGSRCAISCD